MQNQVTAFTASDFSRTYNTNGDGSDHGWGSHHLIMGGAVKGGDIYGTMPSLALGGPDDTGRGRWIPSTSVDAYSATLATWFGVSPSNLPVVLPNIGRFPSSNLGFMSEHLSAPTRWSPQSACPKPRANAPRAAPAWRSAPRSWPPCSWSGSGIRSARPFRRPAPARAGLPPSLAALNPGQSAAAAAQDAPSHLADDLNRPAGDIHEDLRTIEEIFRQYRSSTRQLNPVGENAEITAVLDRPQSPGFRVHPAESPGDQRPGRTVRPLGNALLFPRLSGTQMEIRSAGPDRKLWTADDEVLTPGLNHPPL